MSTWTKTIDIETMFICRTMDYDLSDKVVQRCLTADRTYSRALFSGFLRMSWIASGVSIRYGDWQYSNE